MRIRDAGQTDAEGCAAIYRPYVIDTAITFESEPPSRDELTRRIAEAQRDHAWLVAEEDGSLVGYAYARPYKERAAYRWSCEVSVYVAADRHGAGIGRRLYTALLERLATRGFRTAVAGMTLPNAGSIGLHDAMGFEEIGVFRRIGWKFDRWHDVRWAQREIGAGQDPPHEPR